MPEKIFVIGAGPAGYGAARKLHENNRAAVILEKNRYFGGHCASFEFDEGFVFDDGPHISFTEDQRIIDLFNHNAGNDVSSFVAYVDNYWHGHWVKHPAITSLYGLSAEMNTRIATEIAHNQSIPEHEVNVTNYEEWLFHCYGETYTREFTNLYTRKYHTLDSHQLTTDWLGPRLYKAPLDEVIFGMLTPETPDRHYIKYSRYPNRKGFVNFISEVEDVAEIRYGSEVTGISVLNRSFTINAGDSAAYDRLVSSMPLDMLVGRITDAPADVKEAAAKLACTEAVIVNLGINRPDVSNAHWSYVYDEDISCARLSFPHKFSAKTVPDGCSSIQVEVYFSKKYRPFNTTVEVCVDRVIDELIHMGLLESRQEVIFKRGWLTPYAQVIFDEDRQASVELIHSFLTENGIEYCGRFGEWAYIWSDESFASGEAAAERALASFV